MVDGLLHDLFERRAEDVALQLAFQLEEVVLVGCRNDGRNALLHPGGREVCRWFLALGGVGGLALLFFARVWLVFAARWLPALASLALRRFGYRPVKQDVEGVAPPGTYYFLPFRLGSTLGFSTYCCALRGR